MRKLPMYGTNPDGRKPDFEWPTAHDISKMPQDKPIKVVAIEWQLDSYNMCYIGGIRLVFSNGQKSPPFFAYNQRE